MAQDTFEQAYRQWYPAVVRSAWSITRDLGAAEELAQEAFVKAYGRWRRLERGGHAQPWIHRAAMNLALSWLRRNTRGRQLEAWVGEHTSPPDPVAPPGHEDPVVLLLSRLPRRQREAVFLRVVADLPEAAVAAAMGCSVGSVKVHKKRGLEALRDFVADDHAARAARAPGTKTKGLHRPQEGAGHVARN